VKTFVILHPYGTADGYKAVYSGAKPGRSQEVVTQYKAAGWGGDIYVQRARTFHEAVVALAARLDKKEQHA